MLLFAFSTLEAQEPDKQKGKAHKVQNDSTKVTYILNDKEVNKKIFDYVLSGLTEIQGTWFCAETSKGGITGYDANDKNGVVYEYRTNSEPFNNKCTITKKPILEKNDK